MILKFKENKLLFVLGLYLLVSVLFNVIVHYKNPSSLQIFFWFCDFATIVLVIGIFLKNEYLVTAVAVTAIPAQFLWIGDFLLQQIGYGFGRTNFVLNDGLLGIIGSLNLHATLIPISLYAVWKIGFKKKSLGFILILFSLLLVSTFLFSDVALNKNCVFFDCDYRPPYRSFDRFDFLNYFLIHSLLYWLIVMSISYYILKYLFRKRLV